MKNSISRIFIMILFSMYCGLTAQNNSIVLNNTEIEQVYSTHLDTSGQYTATFGLNDSLYKYKNFTITKKGSIDSLFVLFYDEDPKKNKNAQPIDDFSSVNKSLKVDYKDTYKFIKVRTTGKSNGRFSIRNEVFQDIEHCSGDENYFNTRDKPVEGPSLNMGSNCFELCNVGCKAIRHEELQMHQFGEAPVKWINFPVSQHEILDIQCNGALNTIYNCYGVKDGKYKLLKSFDSSEEGLKILQLSNYESLLIGVYFKDNSVGNFSLCVNKYEIKKSCVDFFDKGQILDVLYTSKGSSPKGPYQYSEEVTFVYKLIDWMPINENWLHGLYLSHGTGWKGIKIDSITGKQLISTANGYAEFDTVALNRYVNYTEKDSLRIPGFQVKNLILPGYYVKTTSGGPAGPGPNYRWGKKFDAFRSTPENPLMQIVFTLVADSVKSCEVPLDGFVEVIPLTDFETGKYDVKGCDENKPIEILAEIKCCSYFAQNSFKDTVMCHGEEFAFTNLTTDTCTYQIINKPKEESYSFGKQVYTKNLTIKNEAESIDSIDVKVRWDNRGICKDSAVFRIISKPKRAFNDLDFNGICKGQYINLTEKLNSSRTSSDVNVNLVDLYSFESYKDSKGEIYLKADTSTSQSLNIRSSVYCDTKIGLNVDVDECAVAQKLNLLEDIDMTLSPNPTISNTYLTISNDLDTPNWKMSIYNGLGDVIFSNYYEVSKGHQIQIPIDLTGFPQGLYMVSIDNGEVVLTKRLIYFRV